MGNSEGFRGYGHIHDWQPSPNRFWLWSCTSRRPHDERDRLLLDNLYSHIPAGIYGFGLIEATAMELERPSSYTRTDLPVHRFTAYVDSALRNQNRLAVNHTSCAIHDNVLRICRDVAAFAEEPAAEDEAVLKRAKEFNPRLEENRFYRIAEAFGRLLAKDLIAAPAVSAREFAYGRASVKTAQLKEEAPAIGWVANWRPGVAFDTKTASEQGLLYHHASLGNLSNLHEVVQPYTMSRLESIEDVTTALLGVVSTRYLLDSSGNQLPIYRLEAPA
jgi:hypothetical protein